MIAFHSQNFSVVESVKAASTRLFPIADISTGSMAAFRPQNSLVVELVEATGIDFFPTTGYLNPLANDKLNDRAVVSCRATDIELFPTAGVFELTGGQQAQ